MNKIIYVVVVIMCLLGCRTRRETMKDTEALRMAERVKLTEIQGVRVVYGSTWMSEGISVIEQEVHYSAPDSSGRQSVTKTVTRTIKAKKDVQSDVQEIDSMAVKDMEQEDEVEASDEHKETMTEADAGGFPWGVVVGLVVVACLIRVDN
jgi:uncharacterized lipoprotein NlpE involved in copper resistance